ncbi:MAG: hypothetical protein PHQ12_09890 [Chthoniobacteraceae bacterium]|nr:hypothetical protein [Chthoniobacteraceae bacterium]
MSESSPQTISLNDIGLRYLSTLQHLSDLMVLTWAGERVVTEQGYEEVFRSIAGLPSTQFRFKLEAARVEAARWQFKNSLGDLANLCLVFLEDIRKVCGLVVFNIAKTQAAGDLAALAAEINSDNGPQDIPTRLQHLKDRYGLKMPLEAELSSLAAVARCFTRTGGAVPKDTPELTLRLKAIQPPAEGSTEPRLADYQRTWKTGERIAVSREEHAAVFTTISVFLSSMLAVVQEFAKTSGLPDNPPSP